MVKASTYLNNLNEIENMFYATDKDDKEILAAMVALQLATAERYLLALQQKNKKSS